jgi:putative ABC transport system permease protein
MLSHYVTVAFRNLVRHKIFSTINILGLTLGMSCCLFIFIWVQDEKSIDNFHVNGKNLYAVYETVTTAERIDGSYATSLTLGTTNGSEQLFRTAAELKKSIPEIKYAASYATGYDLPWGHPETFQVGDKAFKLEGSRASEDFFKMFSYPLLAGDAGSSLNNIGDIVISRKMAALFFNKPEDAIGKSIRFENVRDLHITAVFDDVPPQSSLKFDYLISWETFVARQVEVSSNYCQLIVQLNELANPKNADEKMKHFLDAKTDRNGDAKISFGLLPFADQYLMSNFENGKPSGGRIEYLRIFSGVAVFILLMACINFMNLATARSVKRAKEVGVRKVVGSSRLHLILQFLGESMLLSLLSLVISLALMHFLLPVFNEFTGKQIASPLANLNQWAPLLGLAVFTGIVAGSYPALFLSSLKPVRILKGVIRFTTTAIVLRRSLAVFQFVLSTVLLIATIVVSRQTYFVQHAHLGYDRENVIYLTVEGELNKKYDVFKEKAAKMPGIAMVDRSSEAPHNMGFTVADAIHWEGKEKGALVGFKPTSVGLDFIKLMNLQIIEGRNFSRKFSTDTSAFMINEEAVKQMGIKDPIGKWISAWGKKGTIIAILKNYHTNSLHQPIMPLIVDVKEDLYFGVIMIKTEAGKTQEALSSLESVYKEINPNYPFVFKFLDEEYNKFYQSEQLMSKLSNAFAVVAIMISCLGLLGLVMFSAEQRVKEIGIRKVLGASVPGIVTLLSRDFLRIVFLSFIIAAPIAWYFMHQWLQKFAYKIDLSWWIFALAGMSTLLIALLTIIIQAVQSAAANPVKSLRSE